MSSDRFDNESVLHEESSVKDIEHSDDDDSFKKHIMDQAKSNRDQALISEASDEELKDDEEKMKELPKLSMPKMHE